MDADLTAGAGAGTRGAPYAVTVAGLRPGIDLDKALQAAGDLQDADTAR